MSESRFTEALARFVAAHDPLSLPGPVRVSARQAMADCMGCALAGVGDPAAEIVRKAALDEPGGCTVWGTALRATARNAALVNGTAAHALALDDTNESMRGHPSAPIVPAVFAVGEEIDASGESLVAAYAVGVEVAAKLGRAVNDTHSERGWHTTMTLGTVGAACAVAHLLKLDVIETRHAIGIAATMAGGIRANFGTMTKALGPGLAAQNGILAARLAGRGFTANPEALEAHEGFMALFGKADHSRLRGILEALASPFELDRPGLVFKTYPNCSLLHTTIDMLLDGVEAGALDPANIRKLRIAISPRLERMRVKGRPVAPLQAKFSVEYAAACALVRGSVSAADFTDDALEDAALDEMMSRITVTVGAGFGEDNGDLAEVSVERRDGSTWFRRLAKPRGHITNPLPEEALRTKFIQNARGIWRQEQALAAWDALMRIETMGCRAISAVFRAPVSS